MRRFLGILTAAVTLAGTSAAASQVLAPRTADAYMLMCCQFPANQAPKLIMSEDGNYWTDNSSWMKSAVTSGVSAWNGAPTNVYISLELYADNAPILFFTPVMSSSSDRPSGGCIAVSGNVCTQALEQLYEGCSGNVCAMQNGSPNYDMETVAHETGHALGLDHSCNSNVLMSGPNPNCSNGGGGYSCTSESNCVTGPQQDDIRGAVRMYGSDSYQNNGGCARTKPPVAAPNLSVPVPVLPPLPESNNVGAAEGDAQSVAGDPFGVVNEGTVSTGKVVPWDSVRASKAWGIAYPILSGISTPC